MREKMCSLTMYMSAICARSILNGFNGSICNSFTHNIISNKVTEEETTWESRMKFITSNEEERNMKEEEQRQARESLKKYRGRDKQKIEEGRRLTAATKLIFMFFFCIPIFFFCRAQSFLSFTIELYHFKGLLFKPVQTKDQKSGRQKITK